MRPYRLHTSRTVHRISDFPGRKWNRTTGLHHGSAGRASGECRQPRIEETALFRYWFICLYFKKRTIYFLLLSSVSNDYFNADKRECVCFHVIYFCLEQMWSQRFSKRRGLSLIMQHDHVRDGENKYFWPGSVIRPVISRIDNGFSVRMATRKAHNARVCSHRIQSTTYTLCVCVSV